MTQETSFTFTTPLEVNVVDIKGEEHLFVEGDISTNDIDLVNDSMTKACQESMQRQIMERSMKLDIEHESFKGETHEEKEISKTKIPAGKLVDATVRDLGKDRYSTRVKGEINRNRDDYKKIKGNLKEGYLDAFSVAFLPIDVTYKKIDGEKIKMLNDVKLLNVALTGNPCNTKAQLTDIVQKSMDAVEDYKKLKELDPSIEHNLVVKENKENPLSYIWNKIMSGQVLDKKEIRLLKAAIDVADNKGTQAQLIKELFDKVVAGDKLSYKEYYLFRELIEIDYQDEVPLSTLSKSHSISPQGNSKLNLKKNSKMTDNEPNKVDPVDDAAADGEDASPDEPAKPEDAGDNESGNIEQKAIFKSVLEEMKAIKEKYDVVSKENTGLKEDMKTISESLDKITEALEKPIHKSPGNQLTDPEDKKAMGNKSVDPLDAF